MTKPNFKIKSIAVALLAMSTFITACDSAQAINEQEIVAYVAPLSIEVKEYKLFNGQEGRAVLQLDGYYVEANFTYDGSNVDNFTPVTTYDADFNVYDVNWEFQEIQLMVQKVEAALEGV